MCYRTYDPIQFNCKISMTFYQPVFLVICLTILNLAFCLYSFLYFSVSVWLLFFSWTFLRPLPKVIDGYREPYMPNVYVYIYSMYNEVYHVFFWKFYRISNDERTWTLLTHNLREPTETEQYVITNQKFS